MNLRKRMVISIFFGNFILSVCGRKLQGCVIQFLEPPSRSLAMQHRSSPSWVTKTSRSGDERSLTATFGRWLVEKMFVNVWDFKECPKNHDTTPMTHEDKKSHTDQKPWGTGHGLDWVLLQSATWIDNVQFMEKNEWTLATFGPQFPKQPSQSREGGVLASRDSKAHKLATWQYRCRVNIHHSNSSLCPMASMFGMKFVGKK